MPLYPYQQRVDQLLRAGRSVILQAPTGAGKTRAALFPFLDGWRNDPHAFPRQCIYAVPMRVLANQFHTEYAQIVADYNIKFGFPMRVHVQTGARPTDPKFQADLIFTTIDQALSSFLTIPYSIGNRLANFNAGALIGSYLVFDEFHLYPSNEEGNGALSTTIQMLLMIKQITPFILMTATFSTPMIQQLAAMLDAEPVRISPDELAAMPSQQSKQRRYRACSIPLSADAVLTDLFNNQRQRVIAICNTVERAQALVNALHADPRSEAVAIDLLHSRFYQQDRDRKEEQLRIEFGADRTRSTATPRILVATQVVEVGLNISCDALHTEMAPAAALVQRAGRCARFAGESGVVLVYDVPVDDTGNPNYAPYHDTDQQAVCERTRHALATMLPPEGRICYYHDELALVDAAHSESDQALLTNLQQRQFALREQMLLAIDEQQRNLGPQLIRDIDTRSIIIHANPTDETVPNPYRYQAISVSPNRLVRWYRAVSMVAYDREIDWIAKIAYTEIGTGEAESPEQRQTIQTAWHVLQPTTDTKEQQAHCSAIHQALGVIALNPALIQYDESIGLRLEPGEFPATVVSPVEKTTSQRHDRTPITRETYAEHIAGLYRVYHQILRDQTAAVRTRIERTMGFETGLLDRAIRLMFATHDLGKLDRTWQLWAHRWQQQVALLRQLDSAFPANYMAAHTDFDSSNPQERQAQSRIQPVRPPHAAESARAARALICALAGPHTSLSAAIITAIVCHHSPHRRADHGPFRPAADARAAFAEAMKAVFLFDDPQLRASGARIAWEGFPAAQDLDEDLIQLNSTDERLLYLLLVRILRYADQQSQDRSN